MIIFLCSFISQRNIQREKTASFSGFFDINKYLNHVFFILKRFINIKILKQNNNSIVLIMGVPNNIYKNKYSVLSRIKPNNIAINNAINIACLLYSKGLKDALATQILISKQYFIGPQDKCVNLYPFALQNYHCLYIF